MIKRILKYFNRNKTNADIRRIWSEKGENVCHCDA